MDYDVNDPGGLDLGILHRSDNRRYTETKMFPLTDVGEAILPTEPYDDGKSPMHDIGEEEMKGGELSPDAGENGTELTAVSAKTLINEPKQPTSEQKQPANEPRAESMCGFVALSASQPVIRLRDTRIPPS